VKDKKDVSLLHIACEVGAFWAVKELVDGGVELTAATLDHKQAIDLAMFSNSRDTSKIVDYLARRLLQRDSDATLKLDRLLPNLCRHGASQVVAWCLEHKNPSPSVLQASLLAAAESDCADTIELLLRHDISLLTFRTESGETALHAACRSGGASAAAALLSHGVEVDSPPSAASPILLAVRAFAKSKNASIKLPPPPPPPVSQMKLIFEEISKTAKSMFSSPCNDDEADAQDVSKLCAGESHFFPPSNPSRCLFCRYSKESSPDAQRASRTSMLAVITMLVDRGASYIDHRRCCLHTQLVFVDWQVQQRLPMQSK
jgi:ankyrin repeat protein